MGTTIIRYEEGQKPLRDYCYLILQRYVGRRPLLYPMSVVQSSPSEFRKGPFAHEIPKRSMHIANAQDADD